MLQNCENRAGRGLYCSNQKYNVNSFLREKYHDKNCPTMENLARFLKRLQQLLHSLHKGTYQHILGMEHTIITIQNLHWNSALERY